VEEQGQGFLLGLVYGDGEGEGGRLLGLGLEVGVVGVLVQGWLRLGVI